MCQILYSEVSANNINVTKQLLTHIKRTHADLEIQYRRTNEQRENNTNMSLLEDAHHAGDTPSSLKYVKKPQDLLRASPRFLTYCSQDLPNDLCSPNWAKPSAPDRVVSVKSTSLGIRLTARCCGPRYMKRPLSRPRSVSTTHVACRFQDLKFFSRETLQPKHKPRSRKGDVGLLERGGWTRTRGGGADCLLETGRQNQ